MIKTQNYYKMTSNYSLYSAAKKMFKGKVFIRNTCKKLAHLTKRRSCKNFTKLPYKFSNSILYKKCFSRTLQNYILKINQDTSKVNNILNLKVLYDSYIQQDPLLLLKSHTCIKPAFQILYKPVLVLPYIRITSKQLTPYKGLHTLTIKPFFSLHSKIGAKFTF